MSPSPNDAHNLGAENIKLVVFDWDQTLWNSWNLHVRAAQEVAIQLKLEPPTAQYIATNYSTPFVKHVGILFPEYKEEATRLYMDFYHSQGSESAYLFPGIAEMLEALKGAGYLLALFSDKRQKYGKLELKSTGVAELFDYVLFLNRRRAYKPNPAGLQQVMQALSVSTDDAMYIGDSPVDMQCAQNCGIVSAAALWGCVNVEPLLDQEPTYVCRTIPELADVLGI